VLAVDEKAGDEADEQTREEEESDEHG